MPNTINLRLLDNKNIIAELNGIPLAQENSYKIIAGEENATIFKIASKPNQYIYARYTVEMVNSQGFGIDETDIIGDTFSLPIGMAVAGYGYMQIRAYQGNEVVPFMTLKIKVWNTLPNWKDHISEGGGGEVNITIDSELSDTSTNPVQNKVIKKEFDNTVGDIETALDNILEIQDDIIENGGASVNITIDSELSSTSENPAQNKVIKEALDGKVSKLKPSGWGMYAENPNGQTVLYSMNNQAMYSLPYYMSQSENPTPKGNVLITDIPKMDYQTTNKKYVDELITEHIDKLHKQWYEDITIADMYGVYTGAVVSLTKLPNPTKIRIERFAICGSYNFDIGFQEEIYINNIPQTFDITPDANGNFSVIVNANKYSEFEYNEENEAWQPSESGDYVLLEENVQLTLHFEFGYSDDRVYTDPETGDFGLCTWVDCPQVANVENEWGETIDVFSYCTVSLYI